MKYIKKFELDIGVWDNVLYKNSEFCIIINSVDVLCFRTNRGDQTSAIFGMARLIRDSNSGNAIILSDEELRQIKLRRKDIESEINRLKLIDINVPPASMHAKSIRFFRSSAINNFSTLVENIPNDAYMELTYKYYPILLEVIKKSKTLGDIIDYFTIIYKQLTSDINLYVNVNKYNL